MADIDEPVGKHDHRPLLDRKAFEAAEATWNGVVDTSNRFEDGLERGVRQSWMDDDEYHDWRAAVEETDDWRTPTLADESKSSEDKD